MPQPELVLLPGLDGTSDLFQPFIAVAPRDLKLRPLRLPPAGEQSYSALTEWVLGRMPRGPVVLVAESFSGPLAIEVAGKSPDVVGLVLCATFVEPPLPRAVRHVVRPLLSIAPPVALLRVLMTGGDLGVAVALRDALRAVDSNVLVDRVDAALSAQATELFERVTQPVLSICATRDRIVPRACSRRIRALKPSAQFAEVDGPHLLLQTKPVEAWNRMEGFVRGLFA